jgi:hypothetical protein
MVKITFYEYLQLEPESYYSKLFKEYFDINKLPDHVCSSKSIYNILIPNDSYDTIRIKLFKETFSEYFKYKISLGSEINNTSYEYDEDRYIR